MWTCTHSTVDVPAYQIWNHETASVTTVNSQRFPSEAEMNRVVFVALFLRHILIPPQLIMSITSDFQHKMTIAANQQLLNQTFVVPSQLCSVKGKKMWLGLRKIIILIIT